MVLLTWLLLGLGVTSLLTVYGLVILGAWVEAIPWFDTAFNYGTGVAAVVAVLLMFIGPVPNSGLPEHLGLLFGLSFAASLVVFLLPVGLVVVRIRKRRGWVGNIAGTSPGAP